MRKNFTLLLLSFITFLDVAVLPRACTSTPNDDDTIIEEKTFEGMSGGEAFTKGDGTKDNPFIIENEANLIYFSNSINQGIGNDGYYELNANIELRRNFAWIPIGFNLEKRFNGHFNGNGYEISKVKMFGQNHEPIGLFGYNYGVIENLGVTNLNVDLNCRDKSIIWGGIAAINSGMITNCYLSGNISFERTVERNRPYAAEYLYFGGIAALNDDGIISYSYSNITLSGYLYIDRGVNIISGIANDGLITNCLAINKNSIDFKTSFSSKFENNKIGGNDIIQCYAYSTDGVLRKNGCTSKDLNTKEFYTEKLGWDEEIWNLDNIIFENGNFLKNAYPKVYNKINGYPDSRNDVNVIERLKLQFDVSIPDTLVEKYNIYYKNNIKF